MDTFEQVFGTDGFGNVLVYALGIAAMYTFFTSMTTWSMGANRAAQEAAQEGELPALLAREHPVHRTPVAAYVVSGLVATAVLLFAAIFVKSQDDLFYAIFSASAAVFLLPYMLLFPSVLDAAPQGPRRSRGRSASPAGRALLAVLCALTTVIVAATFVLFLWPEIPDAPESWAFTGPLLAIVGVTLVAGELIVARQMRRHRGRLLTDDAPARLHPRRRRLPHAGRVRAPHGVLDDLAGAGGQLAPGSQARPGGVRGGRRGDPSQRSGDHGGLRRAVRARARGAPRRGARRRDDDRRLVDARHGADVRRRTGGASAGRSTGTSTRGAAWRAACTSPGTRTTSWRRRSPRSRAPTRYRAPLVLEGGSIHVDGEGTCLATEECLLNHNRNPELTREDIEGHLRDYLGIETVIWLGRGIYLDETDGHVDNIACFLRPGVVALTVCADPDDPQHEISQDARARLDAATDARGRSLEVVELPMPGPILITEDEAHSVDHIEDTLPRRPGDRLAGSYANFYIGTSRVVVPLLDERLDDEVLEILGAQFPGREVVGVPAREILLGGGNIHCITQQVPAV